MISDMRLAPRDVFGGGDEGDGTDMGDPMSLVPRSNKRFVPVNEIPDAAGRSPELEIISSDPWCESRARKLRAAKATEQARKERISHRRNG